MTARPFRRPRRNPLRLLTAGLATAALLTACGGDDPATEPVETTSEAASATADATSAPASDPPTSPAGGATTEAAADGGDGDAGPVTVTDSTGTEVSLDEPADAIVSLSPTATESLFAIDAGDQVVAVDEFSYYPDEAPVTDLSGFEPNAEAVADYEPDLVVVSAPGDIVTQLDALGIPSVVQPPATDFDDVYTQIEQLGVLTGHVEDATDLVGQMQADLDALVADAPTTSEPLTYYHEIDSGFYTTSSESFIGKVYGLFDLVNIADEAAEEAGTNYPKLSPETIVEADPDLIYLANGAAGESPETVAARPGWSDMSAVADDHVVVLPPDVPSRWGPRVVDFAEVIADSLEPFGESG